MKFKLFSESPLHIETECLVIGVTGGDAPLSSIQHIDEACGGEIARLLESGDIETGLGKTTLLHGLRGLPAKRVLITGYGKQEKLDRPRFDRACIAAGKKLRNHAIDSCHVCLHEVEFEGGSSQWRLRQAVKMQVYEAALADALPGGISEKERALLNHLRDSLGIAAADADALERDLTG